MARETPDTPDSSGGSARRTGIGVATMVCAVLFALSLGAFLWNCHRMRSLKIDDAYITYRFAARLAHQGTLRWNLLESPVEGYTSFLAVMISAAFEAAGIDPLAAWKVLGYLFFIAGAAAAAWGATGFCRAVFPAANRWGLPLAVAALWCFHPVGAIHATSGMETMLFTFLLTFLTALSLRLIYAVPAAPDLPKVTPPLFGVLEPCSSLHNGKLCTQNGKPCFPPSSAGIDGGQQSASMACALQSETFGDSRPAARRGEKGFALLALGFLLLGMTRPEGVLWAGIAGGAVWLGAARGERPALLRAMLWFFVLPGAVYFTWRWIYFGSFLPATFYAKAGSALKPGPGRLATYLPSHHEIYKYLRDNWFRVGAVALLATALHALRLGIAASQARKNGSADLTAGGGYAANPPGRDISLKTALRRHTPLVLLAAASLACICFFAHVHLLMNFAHRFLYPFGQTLWLTLALPGMVMAGWFFSCRRAADPAGDQTDRTDQTDQTDLARSANMSLILGVVLALGLVAALGQAAISACEFAYGKLERGPQGRAFSGLGAFSIIRNNTLATPLRYRHVGERLDEAARRAGRQLTLYHHNQGEMMYYAPHWDSVDPIGLLDAYTATRGFSADHVFLRRADLFLLPSRKPDEITVYEAEFLPDVSRLLYRDARMKDYEYLGIYPHLALGSEGRIHVLARRELLREFSWLGDYLRSALELRVEPGFKNE